MSQSENNTSNNNDAKEVSAYNADGVRRLFGQEALNATTGDPDFKGHITAYDGFEDGVKRACNAYQLKHS